MELKSIDQVKFFPKQRVLLRVDFNVPLKNKKVIDDFKIIQTLPTIKFLLKKKVQIIIVSHLGRPSRPTPALSLKPVSEYLAKLLATKITFTSLEKLEKNTRSTDGVYFLENIRFHKEEEKNTKNFAKRLANLADSMVLDGFGVSHRSAASIVGVAAFLPTYAGLLLSAEITGLNRVLEKPRKPFVVVLGGAKMETKIPMLKRLAPLADYILVGGGLANTYYLSEGYRIGTSLVEKKFIAEMRTLGKNKKIIFPVDAVYGTEGGKKVGVTTRENQFKLPGQSLGFYDIGPKTIQLFAKYLRKAETIVWNGALGFFEQRPYHFGTYAIAQAIAARAKGRAFGVAGGGETVEVIKKLGLLKQIDLVSTGGGAMLEFLSGAHLPGVTVVTKK